MKKTDTKVTSNNEGTVQKNLHLPKSLNDRLETCVSVASLKKGKTLSQRDILISGLKLMLKKFGV